MSTRKKTSDSAFNGAIPTVFDGLAVDNGTEVAPSKKNGTKAKKVKLTEAVEEELDSRELLRVLSEVKNGNFTTRMAVDKVGISGKIYDTLNEIIALNEILVSELNQARNII